MSSLYIEVRKTPIIGSSEVSLNFNQKASMLNGINSMIFHTHQAIQDVFNKLTKQIEKSLSAQYDMTDKCIEGIFQKTSGYPGATNQFNNLSQLRLKIAQKKHDIKTELSKSEMGYSRRNLSKIQESNIELRILASKLDQINNINEYVLTTVRKIGDKNNLEDEVKKLKADIVENVQNTIIGRVVEAVQFIGCGFFCFCGVSGSLALGRIFLETVIGEMGCGRVPIVSKVFRCIQAIAP